MKKNIKYCYFFNFIFFFEDHEIYFQNQNLAICFWASLLMISFEDLILIIYIWVFNTTIEVVMKESPIQTTICTTFRLLTKNNYSFSILKHFF